MNATRSAIAFGHRFRATLVAGRHEHCAVWPVVAAADPYLIVAPVADPLWMGRSDEHLVHVEDGLLVQLVCKCRGRLQGAGVRHDDGGIVLGGITRLGEGEGLCAEGDVGAGDQRWDSRLVRP